MTQNPNHASKASPQGPRSLPWARLAPGSSLGHLGRKTGPYTYIHAPTGSDLQTRIARTLTPSIHTTHTFAYSRACAHVSVSTTPTPLEPQWSLSISLTRQGPGMHPPQRRSEWELSCCSENKIKYPFLKIRVCVLQWLPVHSITGHPDSLLRHVLTPPALAENWVHSQGLDPTEGPHRGLTPLQGQKQVRQEGCCHPSQCPCPSPGTSPAEDNDICFVRTPWDASGRYSAHHPECSGYSIKKEKIFYYRPEFLSGRVLSIDTENNC